MTNILRDIDEDAAIGRVYLPNEALNAAGLASCDIETLMRAPALDLACEPVIANARDHFAAARKIMAGRPRSEIRAPLLMADAYEVLLDKLTARGFAPPRIPVRLSKARLFYSLLRNGFM